MRPTRPEPVIIRCADGTVIRLDEPPALRVVLADAGFGLAMSLLSGTALAAFLAVLGFWLAGVSA